MRPTSHLPCDRTRLPLPNSLHAGHCMTGTCFARASHLKRRIPSAPVPTDSPSSAVERRGLRFALLLRPLTPTPTYTASVNQAACRSCRDGQWPGRRLPVGGSEEARWKRKETATLGALTTTRTRERFAADWMEAWSSPADACAAMEPSSSPARKAYIICVTAL